jgi:Histidine kinase-, DNA gyrase B-, and HSP90-like ATPase
MVNRARSLIDQYRSSQTAKTLIDKARTAAAQLLNPPPPVRPRHAVYRPPPARSDTQVAAAALIADQDALAGVCANLALRDLNLVDSLLAQLEQMEAAEENPDTLAQLYGLDHLATRLRRNAENLRVLAGQEAGGAADETSSLVDVIRAAMSSIEQYPRVEVGRVAALAVVGFAADDIGRLLAELLDNATTQSPPTTTVMVSAHLTERGSVLLRIEDAGIGLPEQRQSELNDWLGLSPVLDGSAIEHMGLAVVRRLAHKHGVRVTLGRRAPHGTTATVLLPLELVREAPPTTFTRAQPPPEPPAPAARPDEHRTATVSGLPRRNTRNNGTRTADPRTAPTTTRSGLPRRQPHSLRTAARPPEDDVPPVQELDIASSGRQFVSDLAAFAEGEQEARSGHLPDPVNPLSDNDSDSAKGGPGDE